MKKKNEEENAIEHDQTNNDWFCGRLLNSSTIYT